jgi:hypothetical protein
MFSKRVLKLYTVSSLDLALLFLKLQAVSGLELKLLFLKLHMKTGLGLPLLLLKHSLELHTVSGLVLRKDGSQSRDLQCVDLVLPF